MRFNPKSEEEATAGSLLMPGTYDFDVVDGKDAISKAGNDMIALTLHVFAHDGSYVTVFDYLMEKVAYKLRHGAIACGLGDKYDEGDLSGKDFVGQNGKCKIRIDKQDGYSDKNVISDYVVAKPNGASTARQEPRSSIAKDLDDDIPF